MKIERIAPRDGVGFKRIHDPQCTNNPCDCAERGSLVYEHIVPAATHYIPYFTRDGAGGTQEAACTAYVDLSCHSVEPSCWGCRAWLDNDADALKKLRDVEKGAD